MICTNCYYEGKEKTYTAGSLGMELFLWLFFFWLMFLPGIAYSIWRLTTRKKACPMCKGEMIDVRTPRGQELLRKAVKISSK